jgi:hypothetical protein
VWVVSLPSRDEQYHFYIFQLFTNNLYVINSMSDAMAIKVGKVRYSVVSDEGDE